MAKSCRFNPIVGGHYADPEARFYEGRYWIYATCSQPFELQKNLTAFSSTDRIHWTAHENLVEMRDFPWVERAVWAPTVIQHKDKYYLVFASNDIHSDEEPGGLEIAVSDSPAGPFRGWLGRPLIGEILNGAQPIDAHLFQDDDGTVYLYYGGWGHCNAAILNDRMDGFQPLGDGQYLREITPERYVEGPCMIKRDGLYYFLWSTGQWAGDDYAVLYGVSRSPLGPFPCMGTVLETDEAIARSPGHNSYFYLPDSDSYYIVYHRREIPDAGAHARRLCMDKMVLKDGRIFPVTMTRGGF